jgi:hypothetical protein
MAKLSAAKAGSLHARIVGVLVLAMRLTGFGEPRFASLGLKLGPNGETESAGEDRRASDEAKCHGEPSLHIRSPSAAHRVPANAIARAIYTSGPVRV